MTTHLKSLYPGSNEVPTTSRKSLWTQLRSTILRRKGLVEILPGHPKYDMTEVLRFLLLYHLPSMKPLSQLAPKDYKNHLNLKIEMNRLKMQASNNSIKSDSIAKDDIIQFCVFAPKVFASLRSALGMSHQSFIKATSPKPDDHTGSQTPSYLEYLSNSKGNTDGFFFTCDRRFIFKIETEKSIKIFMGFLEDYLGHFIGSPHSLIVKIVGVYSIQIGRQKKCYLIVMQSIFWPTLGITDRYDVKGCLKGRYEDPEMAQLEESMLKDQNFVKVKMELGREMAWFREQLHRDMMFLRRHRIVDYSLLVGIQPRNGEPKKQTFFGGKTNFGRLVSSIKRSSLSFGQRPSIIRHRSSSEPSSISQYRLQNTKKLSSVAFIPKLRLTGFPGESYSIDIPDDDRELIQQSRTVHFNTVGTPETTRSLKSPAKMLSDLAIGLTRPTIFDASKMLQKNSKVGPLKEVEEMSLEASGNPETINTEKGINRSESFIGQKKFLSDVDKIEVCALEGDATKIRRHSNSTLNDWIHKWPEFHGPENRRLLPDSANGIHILDGIGSRYYFGIIDIFTEYGPRQKLSRILKTIMYFSTDHSSAPPDLYGQRLVGFIDDRMA